MTISVDGWAVINRQGRLMLNTVRQHKRDTVGVFLKIQGVVSSGWSNWENLGYRLTRVSIREVEE